MGALMTEPQKKLIAEAVAQAERTTAGEIVPVVLRESDSYPDAQWRAAIVFAFLVAGACLIAFPHWAPHFYFWAQAAGLFAGLALGSLPGVRRLFLIQSKTDEEVRQRAIEAFHTLGLGNSKGKTGILILVSMLEHQVVVLADSGINAKVTSGTWDGLVKSLTSRIRAGQLADGLVDAVKECGRILAQNFPAGPDDVNELPNRPVIEA
jgi:putative membrane protein